jgi:hypothetical protein
MENKSSKTKQSFEIIGALIAWLAVIFQLYLIIINREVSLGETIIRFISFFTILTNIIVAVCFTLLAFKSTSSWGNFFSKPQTQAAIAVYIFVVGLTYNIILRGIWNPQGLQRIVDELLHVVVPIYFVLYWFIFSPKNNLQWKNVFPWLIYPFLYLVYTLIRGAFVHYYPYPFVDADKLGINTVLVNSGVLFILFFLLSLLFVWIGKMLSKS